MDVLSPRQVGKCSETTFTCSAVHWCPNRVSGSEWSGAVESAHGPVGALKKAITARL